jgi:hypothetical protein
VQCSCIGARLRYKPGWAEDGRRCEQEDELKAVLQSESFGITVMKPGASRVLSLIVEAHGEAELAVEFDVEVNLTLFDEMSSGTTGRPGISRSVRIDQPSVSAFGQHIEWTPQRPPPKATWRAELDGNKSKYADTKRHDFTVRLKCASGEQSCAADGDVITTVVQLRSPQNSRLQSEVRFQTKIEALASCERSKAALMQSDGRSRNASVVPAHSSLRTDAALVFVELLVFDVDGIPIQVSRPESEAQWSSSKTSTSIGPPTKPLEDGGTGNRFVASVEPSLRNTRGSYTLRVGLLDAWNETLGARGKCVLLEQTVSIEASVEASLLSVEQVIIVSVIGVLLVIVAVIAIYVVRKHPHRARELVLSFLRREALLAFKIMMELLDISGDSTCPTLASTVTVFAYGSGRVQLEHLSA